MSTNTELFHKSIELLNAQNASGFRELQAPDVEYVSPLGTFQGRDAVTESFAPEWKAFPDGRHQVLRIQDTDTGVVAECTWSGTHTGPLATPMGEVPASGRRVTVPYAIWVDVEAGLANRIRVYVDQMDYAIQLGLMPAPQPV